MTINVWHPPTDLSGLRPDLPVWTMRLTDDDSERYLCDVAWTEPAEMDAHHWRHDWFREGRKVDVLGMTLRDYLRAHVREIKAMNPFHEAGRMEFLRAWQAAHNVNPSSETNP